MSTFFAPHDQSRQQAVYLVFDVETVPTDAFQERCPTGKKRDAEVRKPDAEGPDFHLYRDVFPGAAEHQVVSVVALTLDSAGRFLTGYMFGEGVTEEQRLTSWTRLVRAFPHLPLPCLVSWNGRGFDVPVLAARCMRYGLSDPTMAGEYDYRYAKMGPGVHWDLMDRLSGHGAARNGSLDAYARLIGLPGKVFGDGDSVAGMVAAGRHADVDRYCSTDVMQTAFIFNRWQLAAGRISVEQYQDVAAVNLDLARTREKFDVDENVLLLNGR